METMTFKPKEKKARGKSVTLWFPQDQVARLDRIAKKTGVARAEIIRQATQFALESAEAK